MEPISRDQAIPAGRAGKTLQGKRNPLNTNKHNLTSKQPLSKLSVKCNTTPPRRLGRFSFFDTIPEHSPTRYAGQSERMQETTHSCAQGNSAFLGLSNQPGPTPCQLQFSLSVTRSHNWYWRRRRNYRCGVLNRHTNATLRWYTLPWALMTSSLAGIDCPQALQAPLFPNNLKQRMVVGTGK